MPQRFSLRLNDVLQRTEDGLYITVRFITTMSVRGVYTRISPYLEVTVANTQFLAVRGKYLEGPIPPRERSSATLDGTAVEHPPEYGSQAEGDRAGGHHQ